MEEIRETALAYYANLPKNGKEKTESLFKEMDSNGDGRVTLSEYENKFKKVGLKCDIPKKSSLFKDIFKEKTKSFFKELDQDGDETLDFDEFITLYYLLKSGRLLFCDGHNCEVFLKGLFFCCPKCLEDPKKRFTLCLDCFRNKNHNHAHSLLVDNYATLMSTKPQKSTLETVVKVLDCGVAAVGFATTACTIM